MANNTKRQEQPLMNGKPAEEVGAYIAMPEELKENCLVELIESRRGKSINDYRFLVVNGEFCGTRAVDIVNTDPNTMLLLGYMERQTADLDIILGNTERIKKAIKNNRQEAIENRRRAAYLLENLISKEANLILEEIGEKKRDGELFVTHGGVYSVGPVFCHDANLMGNIRSESYIIFTKQGFPRGLVTAEEIFASRKTHLNQANIAKSSVKFYDFY